MSSKPIWVNTFCLNVGKFGIKTLTELLCLFALYKVSLQLVHFFGGWDRWIGLGVLASALPVALFVPEHWQYQLPDFCDRPSNSWKNRLEFETQIAAGILQTVSKQVVQTDTAIINFFNPI